SVHLRAAARREVARPDPDRARRSTPGKCTGALRRRCEHRPAARRRGAPQAQAGPAQRVHSRSDRELPPQAPAHHRRAPRGVGGGEMAVTEDLKRLAVESICGTILGLDPGDELRELLDDYARVAAAFVGLPIDLPGTTYRAGLKARDRILAVLREQVRKHERQPGTDGLSRILAAASAAGEPFPIETAALEMHHFVLAGVIVFAELAAIVRELHDH